jgi:hypothetical protein
VSNRLFVERLQSCLDEIGLPEQQLERLDAFAKLLSIPKFKAEAVLSGQILFDDPLISQLAEELEVSVAWLSGKEDE